MNYTIRIYDHQGSQVYTTYIWLSEFDLIPEYIFSGGVYYARLIAALPDCLRYQQIMVKSI